MSDKQEIKCSVEINGEKSTCLIRRDLYNNVTLIASPTTPESVREVFQDLFYSAFSILPEHK